MAAEASLQLIPCRVYEVCLFASKIPAFIVPEEIIIQEEPRTCIFIFKATYRSGNWERGSKNQ